MFRRDNGDVILQSSDCFNHRVYKAILSEASPFFSTMVTQNSLENKCPFCTANMLKVLRQQIESIARAIDEQIAAVSRFEAAYTL